MSQVHGASTALPKAQAGHGLRGQLLTREAREFRGDRRDGGHQMGPASG